MRLLKSLLKNAPERPLADARGSVTSSLRNRDRKGVFESVFQQALKLALTAGLLALPALGMDCVRIPFQRFGPANLAAYELVTPLDTGFSLDSGGVYLSTDEVASDQWEIERNGIPFIVNPAGNPDGTYPGYEARQLVNSLCE